MKYTLVHNAEELTKVMREVEKKADKDEYGYAREDIMLTNFDLMLAIVNEKKGKGWNPYNFRTSDQPDSRIKIKTDKVKVILMWNAEVYIDKRNDNPVAHVTDLHGTPDTFLEYKGITFRPSFWRSSTTAEWSIFNDQTNYESIRYARKLPAMPNRMSTVTEKTMEAWYVYLTERRNLAQQADDAHNDAWYKFKNEIYTIAAQYGLSKEVTRNQFGTFYMSQLDLEGEMVINGIDIRFSYDPRTGYINKKIALALWDKTGRDMVENFKRLCNNDWNK